MPHKFETYKIPLPKDKDRRRKLSDEDKEIIKMLYEQGESIRAIARRFEKQCSRRNIQFVLFPERLKRVNFSGHWEKYYSKERNTKAIRDWRRYKQELYKKGELKIRKRGDK